MHMESRMPDQPVLDGGGLRGAVVVHHEVDIQYPAVRWPRWFAETEGTRRCDAGDADPDDRSGGDVQGREQRGGPVALV